MLVRVTAGELLREARERHGLTQAQLARRAGTSQAAISRIENDRISPTVETLAELLDLLGEKLVLQTRYVDWGHDATLLRESLALSPLERARQGAAAAAVVEKLREAVRR